MGNMPNAVKSPAQRLSRLEARREKLLVIIHRTRTRWEKADKAAQKHMRALVKLERQLIRMDKTIAKAKVETANELVETATLPATPVAVETDHLPEPEFEKLAEKMKPKRKRKAAPDADKPTDIPWSELTGDDLRKMNPKPREYTFPERKAKANGDLTEAQAANDQLAKAFGFRGSSDAKAERAKRMKDFGFRPTKSK